ncbi:MAG: EAL domain-containing protein [Clostridiales bacterium]|nr:EAL domain-containing protein [Clostridiales bacterium]
MKGSDGEKITRQTLISYVKDLPLAEYYPLVTGEFKAVAVIDPWEKEICFSDEMSEILGIAAGSFMYMSQYYQHIPESERASVTVEYEAVISELMEKDTPDLSVRHKLNGINSEVFDLEVSMKVESIGRSRFILAVIKDKTPDVRFKSFNELFGPDINSYLFVYDVKKDLCLVSDRFVKEFDLTDPRIPHFSEAFKQYVHPDDVEMLHEAFIDYVDSRKTVNSLKVRFLAPGRGEIYLRTDGFSDYASDGRYISGIYSDVTEYVDEDFLRDNMIDGLNAVIFNTDLKRNITTVSENIHSLFPDFPLTVEGDFIETLIPLIIPSDRQRFRNVMNRSVQEIGTSFSIEVRIRNGEDRSSWVAVRGKSFENKNSMTKMMTGSMLDLTAMNEVKENYEKAGSSHEITGLPTRQRLIRDLDRIIRDRNSSFASVIVFDVNDFHELIDRYGMPAGDRLLLNLADFLTAALPERSWLYHIGADNFAILWPESSRIKTENLMKDIITRSEEPFVNDSGKFFITLFAAASFYPEGKTPDEILSQAEISLHKVKEEKTLRYASFSPADKNALKEKLDFQMTISTNINNGFENFMLYYQPLTDAKTGQLKGAEALLRWIKPGGEPENPEKVVAALEANNQMNAVGRWILNEAVRQCSEWISKGAPKDFYVHVNATADDLISDGYVDRVVACLKEHKLAPENILIELTETSLMQNMSSCRRNIELLHEHNIRTALDDFGSGYSSFNYLKELPVDEIKIDKSFVDDMLSNRFDNTFISAMTMLAHSIGKGVVVEGVETKEQYEILRDMDADIIQGYYFGKPMSVFAFWNKYFI